MENIPIGCNTVWCRNSTTLNCKALHRVVQSAQNIVGGEVSFPPSKTSTPGGVWEEHGRIIKDSSHPCCGLVLPSGRRYRSVITYTSRVLISTGHLTAELVPVTPLTAYSTPSTSYAVHIISYIIYTCDSGLLLFYLHPYIRFGLMHTILHCKGTCILWLLFSFHALCIVQYCTIYCFIPVLSPLLYVYC